jgi:hypothetical protein
MDIDGVRGRCEVGKLDGSDGRGRSSTGMLDAVCPRHLQSREDGCVVHALPNNLTSASGLWSALGGSGCWLLLSPPALPEKVPGQRIALRCNPVNLAQPLDDVIRRNFHKRTSLVGGTPPFAADSTF